MTVPPNLDLSPELRTLIEESVQNFTAQLKAGTGAFYAMIDSKSWIEQYRTEVTRVIRKTRTDQVERIAQLETELGQLKHVCETQRIALAKTPKRGGSGFGSTGDQ